MRKIGFVRRHAETWKRLEAVLEGEEKATPDELADLYILVTDDLAYARTFYPESDVVDFLNALAQKAHRAMYRSHPSPPGRLQRFWLEKVPRALHEARFELMLAALIFGASLAVGTISALNDASFVRLILGDTYVHMTLQNIAEGDPMAVYKQMHQSDMFLGIAINNIKVSFLAFSLGLFFSLGSAFVLFQNGVMLGTFHVLFYEHGLLAESLLVVYIHGTLEIAAIVIAGGAGLTMGNSLLFPGTLPRLTALREGARRGVTIVVGLVPIFVVAALLEAFVTRHTDMPVVVSLSIIGASLLVLVWYFIYLPFAARNELATPERSARVG